MLGLGHQVCLVEATDGEGECGVKGSMGWENSLGPQSWAGTSQEVTIRDTLGAAVCEVCSGSWGATWRRRAGSG